MAVLRPLKLVITNWPTDADGSPVVEHLEVVNNPENPDDGVREVPFSKVLYIEQEDFMDDPPPKYFRLAPGREVRLRSAYLVTCTGYVKDDAGNVVEVQCTYDPATRGGNTPDGRKVKSTMHWVSADHAVDATVALYERLFAAELPGEATGEPFDDLNPDSRELLTECKVEPALADTPRGDVVQFERLGYFAHDRDDADAVPPHRRPARRMGQHPKAPIAAPAWWSARPSECFADRRGVSKHSFESLSNGRVRWRTSPRGCRRGRRGHLRPWRSAGQWLTPGDWRR